MEGDQCDFDSLSAMLDSAQEDLSDGELDRLAALMEQEQHAGSDDSGTVQAEPQSYPSIPSETLMSSSGTGADSAILEELRRMQEKICLLEAKLSKQEKVDETPRAASSTSSSVALSPSSPHPRRSLSQSSSLQKPLSDKTLSSLNTKREQNVATVKLPNGSVPKTPKQDATAKKVKEIDHDIFCGETPPTKKGKDSKKLKTSRHKDGAGDNNDSDWEDLDGTERSELSKSGQELKQLLKSGTRHRVAHPTADGNQSLSVKALPTSANTSNSSTKSWKEKASTSYVTSLLGIQDNLFPSKRASSSSSSSNAAKKSDPDEKILKDCYSGIRIINPKVSSSMLQTMMENRRMIKVSVLHNKIRGNDIDGDWVTIGIIVHKSEPRVSAKGTNFSFWRLSDLADCERTVTFFLFGNVHKELWKTSVGSVVGVLNASIMPNNEKGSKASEISITVDNQQKVLIMGQSKDMGTCRGRTKAGKSCSNVVNTQQGDYCTYHVQAAYKKMSAKRSELQSGHSGVEPKSFRQVLAKSGGVIYGGNEYFSTAPVHNKKEGVSIKSLQRHHLSSAASTGKAKVNTLVLHDILPEDKELLDASKQMSTEDSVKAFHDLLTVPSVGSMNFVKHLQNVEKSQTTSQGKGEIKSISAADLLKQYKNETKALMARKKKPESSETLSSSSAGCVSNLTPQLGRGLKEGESILLDLDDEPLPRKPIITRADRDKQAAIALIAAKGGITREDPNAVRKEKLLPETQERIKKRLVENAEGIGSAEGQPCSKRSKLLGNLDLDSPEVQKLLKAKSAHAELLTELEKEKQDIYFDTLEKTEIMEEKMMGTMEVKCTAVSCRQCKYTAFSAAQRCRDESHKLKTHQATKRFYQCKDCHRRCVTLDKLPTSSCKKCGGSNFERTSMMAAKTGPKLPTEELLLRGEERKFINS